MQDYKLFIRAVWGGETVYDSQGGIVVQNAIEAQDYMNATYLANGYTIQEIHFTGDVAVQPEFAEKSPRAIRFAYHLVRNVDNSASRGKDK